MQKHKKVFKLKGVKLKGVKLCNILFLIIRSFFRNEKHKTHEKRRLLNYKVLKNKNFKIMDQN